MGGPPGDQMILCRQSHLKCLISILISMNANPTRARIKFIALLHGSTDRVWLLSQKSQPDWWRRQGRLLIISIATLKSKLILHQTNNWTFIDAKWPLTNVASGFSSVVARSGLASSSARMAFGRFTGKERRTGHPGGLSQRQSGRANSC
jgi:hypothetical protein